ncbi:MAG TPA: DUF1697 domain-containing protein [Gemmatimonadaceae bacterium]|nr:DUF1697 domain-containing protein [Gemmatimonadaceae bacterium]
MTTYIALLRGINVGGHNLVSMAVLRDLLADLGYTDGRTLLQSGNLVFRAAARASAGLEGVLEREAERRLGLHTRFIVRSAREWRGIIDGNPFHEEAAREPGRLAVLALTRTPAADRVEALTAAVRGPEIIRAGSKHLYIVYPAGMGTSKLTLPLIEKHLGSAGTARNWNTVLKLGTLAGA